MDVRGEVAIITGAANGIGAALAEALMAAGASVMLIDIDGAKAAALAEVLSSKLPDTRVTSMVGDVSRGRDIHAGIAAAERRLGPVALYFANAGVPGAADLPATDEPWNLAWEINVRAHIRAAAALVPGWIDRGEGYFVSTASAAGLLTQVGSATYSVAKHAAVGFAEWMAITYGARGIGVSCLCPMGVDTALLRSDPDGFGDTAVRAVTQAGAVLAPADVAAATLRGVGEDRFLILPHPEVEDMLRRKSESYDNWIRGMQRYQDRVQANL